MADETQQRTSEYWRSRTTTERLCELERIRQEVYGYDSATAKMERVLEVTTLSALDDPNQDPPKRCD